jgi:hypothetical protein
MLWLPFPLFESWRLAKTAELVTRLWVLVHLAFRHPKREGRFGVIKEGRAAHLNHEAMLQTHEVVVTEFPSLRDGTMIY